MSNKKSLLDNIGKMSGQYADARFKMRNPGKPATTVNVLVDAATYFARALSIFSNSRR